MLEVTLDACDTKADSIKSLRLPLVSFCSWKNNHAIYAALIRNRNNFRGLSTRRFGLDACSEVLESLFHDLRKQIHVDEKHHHHCFSSPGPVGHSDSNFVFSTGSCQNTNHTSGTLTLIRASCIPRVPYPETRSAARNRESDVAAAPVIHSLTTPQPVILVHLAETPQPPATSLTNSLTVRANCSCIG